MGALEYFDFSDLRFLCSLALLQVYAGMKHRQKGTFPLPLCKAVVLILSGIQFSFTNAVESSTTVNRSAALEIKIKHPTLIFNICETITLLD